MKGKLVKFYASDGLELDGLIWEAENSKKCLVHIHGMAGNFYENPFIVHVCQKANKQGLSVLSFNNRGHELMADSIVLNKGKLKSKITGSIHESPETFTLDVRAALNFLEKLGYKEFIIEGHSLGCHKALFTALELKNRQNISGLILLSPWETIGLQKKELKKGFEKALKIAEKLVLQGKGSELMPKWSFIMPLSAKTFLEYFESKTKMNVFEFNDLEWNAKELRETGKPILIVYGTKNESTVNPKKAVEIVSKKARNVTAKTIENASHSYRGYEKQLAKTVIEWITKKK